MSYKIDVNVPTRNNLADEVFNQLSETDKKVDYLIQTSKIIVLIGLVLSIIFSPLTFQIIGVGCLATYSLGLISSTSFLVGLALIVNTAVLGTALHNKEEIGKVLITSPKRVEGMPLGLINRGNNCWANSMIQFMMNIPNVRQSISKLGFFNRLKGIKSILNAYQTEEKNVNVRTSSVDSQKLREILNRVSPGGISSDISRQEDAQEAFAKLSEVLPKSEMKKSYTYSIEGDLPRPKTFSGVNGSELSVIDEKTFVKRENQSFDFIPLSIPENRLFAPSLSDLIDFSFNSKDCGGNFTEFEDLQGNLNRYNLKSENWKFTSAPEDLFFSFNRFVAYSHENESGQKEFHPDKICSKVKVPSVLELKKEKHIITCNANYELDSFIVHKGDSVNFGHYISYVKKNGHWYECNDSYVRPLSEKDALAFASEAYLVYYKKIG